MAEDSSQNLISCRVCGVIMVKLARDTCSKCFQKEEELFQKVKNFLRSNPGSTVPEVARAVDCSEAQVQYFVRTGRLERVGVKVSHPCQICQKTIMDGMICPECKKSLKDQVSTLKRSKEQDDDSGKKKHDSKQLPIKDKSSDDDSGHVGKRKS
jgi:type II secretory ATPase GspE/PulE/Tfp pilus assembly ATPase PilB-like protein